MITEAYEKLSRVKVLAMYPIVFDLLAFIIGLAVVGFHGTSKFTLKFSVNPGLPSINNVLDQTMMANGINFSTTDGAIPFMMILSFIVFFVLGAFVQGGFIGLLHEIVFVGESASFQDFMLFAKKYWLRFLGIQVIVILFLLLGGLVAILMGIFGVVLFLVVFLVLRILYIYWEFTVVAEDCSVAAAFTKAREFFSNRISETSSVILSIFLLNLLFGILVNSLWNPIVFVIAIFAYGYLATGLQIGLMMTLEKIAKRE